MNAKDRVIAALEQREADAVPAGFSCHFEKGNEYGDAGVAAHLAYFSATGGDISKIMNDNRIPTMSAVKTPAAWKEVRGFSLEEEFIRRQFELTRRILEKADASRFMMGTLHGVVAACRHATGAGYTYEETRRLMCAHFRENKQPVKDAFCRMADSLSKVAEQFAALGLDGVMYASLGGERQYFTDEEFAELVAPLDRQVLLAIRAAGARPILHICKENIGMNRYESYVNDVDAFNWGVYETSFPLEEGRKLFKGKTIWGGLANRSGVLAEGTPGEIGAAVQKLIGQFGAKGFILGADCTLPASLPPENIRAAVEAAHGCK